MVARDFEGDDQVQKQRTRQRAEISPRLPLPTMWDSSSQKQKELTSMKKAKRKLSTDVDEWMETDEVAYEYTGKSRVIRAQISDLIFKLDKAMHPSDKEIYEGMQELVLDSYPSRIKEFKEESKSGFGCITTPELLDALDTLTLMRSRRSR
jgi:hypothetical protein